jgi:hypothetical protein
MRFQIETVTPAKAEKWLQKNASNRRPSDMTIAAYARDIEAGNWELTPQAVAFNVNGDLLDGQHRLHAVIKSNKAVKMVIVRGCNHDVRKYIDRGRKRSLSDRMRMEGLEGRIALKASCSSLLVRLDRGSTRELITGDEAVETLEQYTAEFAWLDTATLSRGFKVASYVAPVMWALRLGDRVAEFHEGVQSGVGLRAKSPALAMRNALTRTATQGYASQLDILLKTCNGIAAAIAGRKISSLRANNKGYLELANLMSKQLPDVGTLVSAGETSS